jgi:hypothetical protein
MVPSRVLAATGDNNPDFDREVDDLRRILTQRNGAVVLFAAANFLSKENTSEDDLMHAGGFEAIPVSPSLRVVVPKR